MKKSRLWAVIVGVLACFAGSGCFEIFHPVGAICTTDEDCEGRIEDVCNLTTNFCVECLTDFHCSDGGHCEDQVCVECRNDADCAATPTVPHCVGGACSAECPPNAQCLPESPPDQPDPPACPPGFGCECTDDSDCPTGHYCNQHLVCIDPNTFECFDDGGCPLDMTCNIYYQCE